MAITVDEFGTAHGQNVRLFTLKNAAGNCIQVSDYGAHLIRVEVPDRTGNVANVQLGYDSLTPYLERHPYFGSVVGRFCNRIAAGKFALEGKDYSLAINNGPNHLHGGIEAFDRKLWDAQIMDTNDDDAIRLTLHSPDGDEGYPGNLQVGVTYRWNNNNELSYEFEATTDAPTVVNLTNHAYWNLAGAGSGTVHEHELKLHCDHYLAVDETLIPTGELASVSGTGLDFSEFRTLGERIDQFPGPKGYDHCYVINDASPSGSPSELRTCAVIRDPSSGRNMELKTTQPGVQLYTGNHLEGDYPAYGGFCLETQHFPDSPNHPEFPTTRLDPGDTLRETTVHRFFVE